MHYILFFTFVIALCNLSSLSVLQAQDRVHSGVVYQAGDTIVSPLYGAEAQVPQGWYGILPEDSELFLLISSRDDDSRIFVRASENSLAKLQDLWSTGIELTDNLKIVVSDSVQYRGDIMYADVDVIGQNPNNYRTYVEAKCGDYGKCVGFFLVAQPNNFAALKQEMMTLVDELVLKEPGMKDAYDRFNWQTFLSGKSLASINQRNYSNRRDVNEIHLQEDAEFRSKIEQRGLVDQKKGEYWGRNKGTWQVEGSGKEATLILEFKKHEPLRVNLVIDEDKLYLNGQRFYVMYE